MNRLCEITGAEFPLFAFSHCRDVVAAVSRAGGFGVFGAAAFTPDSLEAELAWIDANVGGKPYGVDLLIPSAQAVEEGTSHAEIARRVPDEHRAFVHGLLQRHGIDVAPERLHQPRSIGTQGAAEIMNIAFRHPIRLIASALGTAPPEMIARGRAAGVPVAALVGTAEHARRQLAAGVDVLVAQGGEAGGHTGEVATIVLVPEVLRTVAGRVPVLAAGGIMTGRQMAGMMAMGAAGVWTGSVWLATAESEVSETFREKMVAASSRDTVRSRHRTGKPARQLRSAWHDAWEAEGAPPALPMPLMSAASEPAISLIHRAADAGNPAAKELVTYFVGQGVGLVDGVRSAAAVVGEFKAEFAEAVGELCVMVGMSSA